MTDVSYAASSTPAASLPAFFEVTPDRIRFGFGGRVRGSYIYNGCWRPYFWPLETSAGNVVRGVDAREHPNQYGLSLAYGGHRSEHTTSIWSDYDEPPWGPCGKMLHAGFDSLERVDDRTIRIAQRTVWVNGRGEAFGSDRRLHEIEFMSDDEMLIRIEQHVRRPGDAVLGSLLLSARVADSIRVKAVYKAEGHVPGEIRDSEGRVGEESTRDQHARWCSYSGRVGTGHGGIALFGHPRNPEHPGKFFTREYGIFTLNQHFGPEDEALVIRWAAYIFGGTADPGRIEAVYQAYARG